MGDKVFVEFTVQDGKREDFDRWLQIATSEQWHGLNCLEGYRADDDLKGKVNFSRREALLEFIGEMSIKLQKNEHKRNWSDRSTEGLLQLLNLELDKFEVYYKHSTPQESRPSLVDLANWAMMLHDRLK